MARSEVDLQGLRGEVVHSRGVEPRLTRDVSSPHNRSASRARSGVTCRTRTDVCRDHNPEPYAISAKVTGSQYGIRTRVARLRTWNPSPPRRTGHSGILFLSASLHRLFPGGRVMSRAEGAQATNPSCRSAMNLLSPRPGRRSQRALSLNHAAPRSGEGSGPGGYLRWRGQESNLRSLAYEARWRTISPRRGQQL